MAEEDSRPTKNNTTPTTITANSEIQCIASTESHFIASDVEAMRIGLLGEKQRRKSKGGEEVMEEKKEGRAIGECFLQIDEIQYCPLYHIFASHPLQPY